MAADVEQRLRDALHARAERVVPDPATWTRVQGRLRRRRLHRWSLAAAAAAGVAAVALAAPSLLATRVRFEPSPADEPGIAAGEPGTAADAAAPNGAPAPFPACGGPGGVVLVTIERTPMAECVPGGTQRLLPGPGDTRRTNPAVAPDGTAVLYELDDGDGAPVIAHLDLATGQEQVLVGGRLPAFAPDGGAAWVQDTGDRDVLVGGGLFSEPTFEIPVEGDGGVRVRRLAWDTVEQRLLYETVDADGDSRMWTVRVDAGRDPRHVELAWNDGASASPAVSDDGTIAVLRRCCADRGAGQAPTRLELVELDRAVLDGRPPSALEARSVAVLDDLGGQLDVASDELFLVPAGRLTIDEDADPPWRRADLPAWLVGDGHGLWLVDGAGHVLRVASSVSSAAANPAVELAAQDPPGDAAQAGEPTPPADAAAGLPPAVAAARQAIRDAAARADFDTLHRLMRPDFSWTYDDETDRDGAIAYLRDNPERLGLVVRLLDLPHGSRVDGAGNDFYVWPRPWQMAPADWTEEDLAIMRELASDEEVATWRVDGGYDGPRIGIGGDGTWNFFISGPH